MGSIYFTDCQVVMGHPVFFQQEFLLCKSRQLQSHDSQNVALQVLNPQNTLVGVVSGSVVEYLSSKNQALALAFSIKTNKPTPQKPLVVVPGIEF